MRVPGWIRIMLTAAIVVLIWKHAHWSVALFATCSALDTEIKNEALKILVRRSAGL